jgi:hypothetical protein
MIRLKVRDVEVYLRRVRTRIPFRYGKAEVTGQPYAHLRVRCEPDVTGVSAAALPPLWFDKRAGLTHEDTIRDLLRSVSIASEVYKAASDAGAWTLHHACEPEARRRAAAEGMNDLTAGFGVALMDAALIDASCRLAGKTFHEGLREDLFGQGSYFGAIIPTRPLTRIAVRHTVGLSDPITPEDVAAPLNDGLPESLQDVIRTYKVRWFKIKLSGDVTGSLDRLRRIAEVLDTEAGEYEVTIDGNEQFHDMAEVADLAKKIRTRAWLQNLWDRTAWIEQPVERTMSLKPEVAAALHQIPKPVIIDESDDNDGAVDLALGLGYGGISAKNCKGVFRTLHSFRRVQEKRAVLSSEDLMNIPVVPLHQDLCVAAALGITHSERNGHHYIRAFDYFSPKERDLAIQEFPELYEAGRPTVKVVNGMMDVRGINAAGFGVRTEPDWDSLEKVPSAT